MKFFEYPYLVQREILENIEYQDLYLLSFVSIKTKKLIKLTQNSRLKDIRYLRYTCNDTNKQPFVDITPKNDRREVLMKIMERQTNKNDYFQLNVSGKVIYFRISNKSEPLLIAYFDPDESRSVIESIHNHNLDFFGDSVEYLWRTDDYENIIPQLQNISTCVEVMDTALDYANLEHFFSESPDLKYIRFYAFGYMEPFSPRSKSYQTECVEVVQPNSTNPFVLRHFQGKQAILRCSEYETSDLTEFVNRWKSGEFFQTFEHLSCKRYSTDLPQNEILNVIGAKHIDDTKTPPTYTVPKM
ncbi:hypothetical protein B9Z55_024892 [Caenorhabditis nigoni]|uniref:F-box domain-containing protein n=1 Tax=Caenorhabditis nigoni TaxID=1611254 RepID=A0A2G5SWQ5_9PELO|nr:hypothetical protein B9Z55_024892 [Caenorhabditis nigoni]